MKRLFCLLAMLLLFAATASAQDLKSVTGIVERPVRGSYEMPEIGGGWGEAAISVRGPAVI